MLRHVLFALLLVPALAAQTLDIYWIDVEGGAATLIVTPAGETVLMDAGWPGFDGRDPKRIEHVLKHEAKKSRIDYFITSHFHTDHTGGLPGLAERVEIGKFVDHGDSVEADRERGKQLWDAYLAVADGKRMQVKPGETLPLEGVDEFLFVAARSKFISKPLGKAEPNPLCSGAQEKDRDDGENGKSVGFVVRQGDFRFLNLGDLTWNYELELACPQNLLGEIDLYQVTHHGMNMSGPAAHVHAIRPAVAVMNNGPRKGGTPEVYKTVASSPGLLDLWQVHKALHAPDSPNTDEQLIANLAPTEECEGHWIKASVSKSGEYTVTNSRNGYSKTYRAR